MSIPLELHCHSTLSDGSLSPEDLALQAHRFGARLFCLTDHDTVDGYERVKAVLEPRGCVVLRAVELSCRAFGRTVHLLAYGVNEGPGLAALRDRLRTINQERTARLRAICERLAKLGIELDADALVISTHGKTPGRPDVARALVQAGYCSSPKEAFTRFLHDGGPAYVSTTRLSVGEGLAIAKATGAQVSLAHPHTLGDHARVRELIRTHRQDGLDGLEALYGKYGRSEREGWLRVVKAFDLVATGGSDYHGVMSPDVPHPVIVLEDAYAHRIAAWLGVDF